jgi:membrane protein YqaA with SNARE-associated domain
MIRFRLSIRSRQSRQDLFDRFSPPVTNVNIHSFLSLAGFSVSLFRFFRRMGVFGVFLFSALDSSFLVLPFGNDLLLIALTSSDRHGFAWIGYVIAAALGSVVGVLLTDLPMRATGEKGLQRFVSSATVEKLKKKIETKAAITIFLTSLLPPPFPFTPVMMTTSALQYPRTKLLLFVFVARLVRYTVEAILALYFGRKLIRYINSDTFSYFVYGLMAVALILSVLSVIKWLSKRHEDVVEHPA